MVLSRPVLAINRNAVVRGTLVIPSEHCRPRDSRDSFGTLSSGGYTRLRLALSAIGYLMLILY